MHLRSIYSTIALIFLFKLVAAQNTKQVKRLIEESAILASHFTGFVLYDCDEDKTIYSLNGDRYFTPASNTKLFTLYTALEMLGDSIPAIRYTIKGDSLIFWGTGDPTLYRKDFNSDKVHLFLKNAPQKLFWAYNNYQGRFYGAGWPYGDYEEYYQAEINALPFGGNLVEISMDSSTHQLAIYPSYFARFLQTDYNSKDSIFHIQRSLTTNDFSKPNLPIPDDFNQQVPWKTSPDLVKSLLEDTLKRPVQLIDIPMPSDIKTIYNTPIDTLFRALMLPSDNFIAEQLLLVCSSTIHSHLNTSEAITYSKANVLNHFPHPLHWADGSGLSRMNLFTPESIVQLLIMLKQRLQNEQRLHEILPTGGLTGTLKAAYQTDQGEPFVWAKTGSLNGVHNQSGYIITRKGKHLIYSFMNNNFVEETATIRKEMVRIITTIRTNY